MFSEFSICAQNRPLDCWCDSMSCFINSKTQDAMTPLFIEKPAKISGNIFIYKQWIPNRQIRFSFQIVTVHQYCVNTNMRMTECSCEGSLYAPQKMYLRYTFENMSLISIECVVTYWAWKNRISIRPKLDRSFFQA